MVAKEVLPLPSQAKPSAAKVSPQAGSKGRRRGGKHGGKPASNVQQQQQQRGKGTPDDEEPSGWAGRVSNIKLLAGEEGMGHKAAICLA